MVYDPDDPGSYNICTKNPETKLKCIQYWDDRSRGYNLTTLLSLHDTEKFEHLIGSLIPKGKIANICDMGTSCGFMAIIAAKMGHNVVGYDLSEKMVDYCRKNATKYHLEINFEVADVEDLDILPNTFDLIIARNILWALTEPLSTLKKWFKILKPGGHILIADGNWYLSNFDLDYAEKQHLSELKNSENRGFHGQTNMDHINFDIIRELAKDLPVSSVRRPGWDLSILLGIGFDNIYVNRDEKSPYEYSTDFGNIALPGSFIITARRPPEGAQPLIYNDGVSSEVEVRDEDAEREASLFKALADPNRVKILKHLLCGRLNVKSLSESTGISVALVSHNLKLLQNAKLVTSTKVGKEVFYMASDISKIRELFYYSDL